MNKESGAVSSESEIMVVDDTPENLKLLVDLLIAQGYRVRPSDDPQLALMSAMDDPPTLILLDVRMPGMSGFELCRRLKQEKCTADIPVIFISALNSPQDKLEAFEAGGVDYITKPIEPREAVARVVTHLDLTLTRKSLEKARNELEEKVRERTADLALREKQFRRLVEKSPDILYRFSSRCGGTYYSPRVEDVLGFNPDHLLEHPMLWHDNIHPDDLERVNAAIGDMLCKKSFDLEYRIRDAQGAWHWFHDRSIDIQTVGEESIVEGLVSDITDRKQAVEDLRLSRERLRALSNHLQIVRESEKKSIAREIHDELGGMLTAIKLDADWLQEKLDDEYYTAASRIVDMTDSVLSSIRRIVTELRPTLLDDMGLWAAIEWQLSEFEKRTGVKCSLDSLCDNCTELDGCEHKDFSSQISIVLFRAVQEALTNVVRHASASRVSVRCQLSSEAVILTVKDNGIGFDTSLIENPGSHGIRGIFERAGSLGGSLQVESKPGGGTTIEICLPLSGLEDHE
ncbi:MAG: response regulator [Candidatus Sedimenticola sp. 20ELBAFRAG]